MRLLFVFLLGFGVCLEAAGVAESQRAWELERKGDAAGALELLEAPLRAGSATAADRLALARFLDRHHDPSARKAYEGALSGSTPEAKEEILRRLAEMDLLDGDRASVSKDLDAYHRAGGTGLEAPGAAAATPRVPSGVTFIPGPLRSFARMAALAPDLNKDSLLAALARNVVTNGYQASSGNEALEQTEYLKLVVRYLSQARELDALGGKEKEIRIDSCDSSQTADLLRVLGYRIRGACGTDLALETVNASRAFLTIDSGFPLAALEVALRTNRPFHYVYGPSEVPVLYGDNYWMPGGEARNGPFIDYFISDPSLCRLYLGLAKLDPSTAEQLRKSMPLPRLRAYAHVLDFFGGMFEIRDGKAVAPGGKRAEKVWGELAGASPENPASFFEKLLAKDDGWLASYYDSLARANGATLAYLTDPARLKRFYEAIRGRVTSPGPARPVFRSNTEMLMLTSRLWVLPDGRPFIPGNLDVWRGLFMHHPKGKYDAKLSKSASGWKEPDDVVEALFGLCRKSVENEPLKIFLALTDLERQRKSPLDAATVDNLARNYRALGSQYSIFSEAPELSGQTIDEYLDVAEATDQIHDSLVRADAGGTLQGLIGLWQIFLRQGAIPEAKADALLAGILKPFDTIRGERDVFDGGQAGVKLLLEAANVRGRSPQDGMIDLLTGTGAAPDAEVQTGMQENLIRIFEAQRLIPLDTLFGLVENLEGAAKGQKVNLALVTKAATRIGEIRLPRAALSTAEKNALAFGYWSERHIEVQRKVNLRAMIDKSAADPKKLDDIRALLAPFLRDTLVGFNYAYYAPPGAQLLLTNPVFVRSHDFVGLVGVSAMWKRTEVQGNGWPASAGGKLVGSLAGLPYALAEAEQNFLVPTKEQALIWGDLVPQILLGATVPRWWRVTPGQLHWVALHLDLAETLYAEAALDPARRAWVIEALRREAPPVRVAKVDAELQAGEARAAIEDTMPSEMFFLAQAAVDAPALRSETLAEEIRAEAAETPSEFSFAAISRAFGTPKPTLTNSYEPQLLNLRTFPALMGYSSRILAESWESSQLYYAALGDRLHVTPSQLNLLVPEWTRQTVERIFATHLEDWPALLRSLRMVGEDALAQGHKTAAGAGGL